MGGFEMEGDSRIEEAWREFTDAVVEGMSGPQTEGPNDDEDSGTGNDRQPRKPIRPQGTLGAEVEITEPEIIEAHQVVTGGISQSELRSSRLKGGGVFHSNSAVMPGGYHGS
jgi:hypothetical protein